MFVVVVIEFRHDGTVAKGPEARHRQMKRRRPHRTPHK